jgi:hypothetical protein
MAVNIIHPKLDGISQGDPSHIIQPARIPWDTVKLDHTIARVKHTTQPAWGTSKKKYPT